MKMPLPKLLLLHGALGSSSQFVTLKIMLKEDFEILVHDFPGHGGREIPVDAFSFKMFMDDLILFLDRNKIDTIDIFGYSMGGYAALCLAKQYPQRVNKIFTLATKMEWNEAGAQKEAFMLIPEKVEEKIPAFAKTLEQLHKPADWKVVMRKTSEMMIALGKNHLVENDFKSIKNETMISVGDKDNMVSISESEKVSSLLLNGKLHIFLDTPHPFEKVDVQKIASEIKLFFTSQK